MSGISRVIADLTRARGIEDIQPGDEVLQVHGCPTGKVVAMSASADISVLIETDDGFRYMTPLSLVTKRRRGKHVKD